ncbi:DUF397 domain-containing protein [Murinocardiopsis flavida]|uniref:DUF397 domain-containing protein n=1 Tax=Murinocardiopsis flavida TaxID=645275 RepID=UPI000D0CC65C|nr:DUF397 domain-containing protein [Murinocardiopsis flavida]
MIARDWNKSSYSSGGNTNCVEARSPEDRIHVRDTQNRSMGHLSFPSVEWAALLCEAKAGAL